jgi:hypothetical protein
MRKREKGLMLAAKGSILSILSLLKYTYRQLSMGELSRHFPHSPLRQVSMLHEMPFHSPKHSHNSMLDSLSLMHLPPL